MKTLFQILALLSTAPGAYFALKKGAIEDIKKQMTDLSNESGVGIRTIRLHYQIVAFIYLGEKNKWTDLFNSDSEVYKKAYSDKSSALRAFGFFVLVFVFTLISIFMP